MAAVVTHRKDVSPEVWTWEVQDLFADDVYASGEGLDREAAMSTTDSALDRMVTEIRGRL